MKDVKGNIYEALRQVASYNKEQRPVVENVRNVENMFGLRAADWRKLVKKHARHIDAFQKGRKDLPKNVEDELLTWAMDNGEVRSKDDAEDFIDIILNAHFEPEGDELKEEDLEEARIPYYKPTKFEGKEFDRKKELKALKNMQMAIHKVAKMQDDMQYTAETGGSSQRGNPHAIYQSLVNAEQAIFDYMGGIERGYYDGIIDMDRD